MNEKVVVGIDCGELDLKTAYILDSKVCSLPVTPRLGGPLIYFDSHGSISSLGVGFPSTLQKMGSGVSFPNFIERVGVTSTYETAQSTGTPESLTKHALTIIRQHVAEFTGRSIGTTVLAVPTGLRQNGRRALLECAQAAGFESATLVDRCTAAGLAYHSDRDKTTALVFDIGYGECEYSLLRLAKDRCRVVASETIAGLSGERLDAMIMEAAVLALRKRRVFLGLKQFTFVHWLEFRRLAEKVRTTLGESSDVTLTLIPEMTGLERPVMLRILGRGFAARVASLLQGATFAIQATLEQNELVVSDLDGLLLVGGVANRSPVLDILRTGFGDKLRRSDAYLVAAGAALQAYQMAQQALGVDSPVAVRGVPEAAGLPPAKPWATSVSEADCEVAEMVSGDEGPADFDQASPTAPPDAARVSDAARSSVEPQDMSVGLARKLAQEGKRTEAAHVINVIIQEINEFVGALQQEESLTVPRTLIQQALAMINTGRFAEAVATSHRAYDMAPADFDVFSKMMKIHVDASLGLDRPEEYDTAITILKCAHGHDQTDRLVHKALAERHYMHAVAMRNLNNVSSALSIGNIALSFDPKHDGANRLMEELTKVPLPPPSQETP